ncbi:MAG TPA: PVC-type heme-binding CxxCH protein [Tepidisphaeraceae bacterium]|nr:PVC-type heme-binding CxxCH protein [Tepidisphaeraceae bacterium]
MAWLSFFIAIVFGVSAGSSLGEAPPARSDKAISIFDGKSLDGWESPAKQLWAVKDGCLTGGDGKNIPYNDFLCTKASYSNFILHLKIKLTGDPKTGFINSGIQIRTSRNHTGHEVCGYQCDYGEPSWYAAIYDEGRRNRLMMKSDIAAIRPVLNLWGWNDYVIKADGGRIKTWINGVQGVDYEEKDPDIASDGIIGIQVHGGGNTIVQVKDVFIEELPPTPNAITWEKLGGVDGQRAKLKPRAEAPRPKFTQRTGVIDSAPKTPSGWDGDMKVWRVEDGAVSADLPENHGQPLNENLVWKGEVQDFELTFDYRITGAGGMNAGILFRGQRLNEGAEVGYLAQLDDGGKNAGALSEEHGRSWVVERGARASIAPDGRRWFDPIEGNLDYRSIAKAGEWNACRVRATATHMELWINGVLFAALDDNQANVARFEGQLAIQLLGVTGPAKIEFRKMLLADLGGTKPTTYGVMPVAVGQQLDVPSIKPLGDNGKPLNLDFETGTLQDWKAEGDAWEGQPVKGDAVALRNRGKSNHAGEYWIGGFEKIGDTGVGRLTSSSFVVNHPWASFLIGGGKNPELTRVEVVDEASGKVIHVATGEDVENMRREVVDLRPYSGKRIFVRLVDASKTGWGHVNFDDFVFHDKPPAVSAGAVGGAGPKGQAPRLNESPVLWHLQPNPAKPTAVANAEAQRVVAGMMLTPGFQAELIAAEPEVRQPIAFAIDERGRIWVAEAYSYPKKQPEGHGKDRILIFEDVDGDGTFKKRTVFYEGLNLVSGLEIGFGGVWVGAAPELLFIPKDKDDKAGKPQVLLDGWGYQDTHETINSFCWGPDGWLYGNQGVFTTSLIGKPGTPSNKRLPLHSGVWRYHPVKNVFEIFAHGGSNQWGLDFNEAGHLFMTHCRSFWGGGGTTDVIRNGHFWNQSNGSFAPFISNSAPDFAPDLKNFLPASARYDDGEGGAGKAGTTAIYGGHAHAGTMIYLGDNWPDIYRDHLFTNNLFGHQMNHEENVREGSAYQTFHAGYDLMFTPDPKYIAVDLQTGPDGAVYIIDWCDLQHCHNPNEEKWDRTNGRIYRVSWAKTYHPVKVDLGVKSDVELAALQTHHNDWYSRSARQILQERAAAGKVDEKAIASLKQLATTSPNYAHVLRAIWTLHVVGALDEATLGVALHHPDDRVRGWAVQLATDGGPSISNEALVSLATHDPSPMVRLALASALPALSTETCWTVGAALASHGEDAEDRFLPKMIYYGLARVIPDDFARGLALAEKTPLPSLANSIRWYAAANPLGRESLVAHIAGDSEEAARQELRILAFGLKNEAKAAMPKQWPAARARFSNSMSAVTNELSALFGDKDVIAKMRSTLADEKAPAADRRAAFELLKRIGDADSVPVYAKLLDIAEFRSEVIPLLSGSNDPATATALIARFPKLGAKDRIAALSTLTSRPALAKTLLQAVKDGAIDKKLLGSFQVRQMRNLQNPEVNTLLDQSWGKVTESSASMKATIARLQKAYQEAPLWAFDAGAGKKTFQQICAVCHTMNGQGGKLGPDLTGSSHNGLAYFLENIVDPNAVVGEQYQMTLIEKRDGSVITGITEQETETAVTIRTVTELLVVPKSEIKDRQKRAESMMPAGILEALPERSVIELLKYLMSKN